MNTEDKTKDKVVVETKELYNFCNGYGFKKYSAYPESDAIYNCPNHPISFINEENK